MNFRILGLWKKPQRILRSTATIIVKYPVWLTQNWIKLDCKISCCTKALEDMCDIMWSYMHIVCWHYHDYYHHIIIIIKWSNCYQNATKIIQTTYPLCFLFMAFWHHDMETLSTLLALCEEKSQVNYHHKGLIFPLFSYSFPIFYHQNTGYLWNITFVFNRCHGDICQI